MQVEDIKAELEDAMNSPRLDDYERRFVEGMTQRGPQYLLSPAQLLKWREIEAKVYAAG